LSRDIPKWARGQLIVIKRLLKIEIPKRELENLKNQWIVKPSVSKELIWLKE